MPMTNRADPSNVELAGAALAEVAAQHRPTSVVSWSATLDVLLAHVVARELGIPRLEADLDLGRLLLDGHDPSDGLSAERVVLVADAITADRPIEPLIAAVAGGGGQVVAVCSARDGVRTADHTP
ncbi:hypothetical protein ACFO1B_02855 [Dactylosporangium siamense]|uniref:Uncharacterized protein n=1 Tax=Dactylosporangium siamense TaxID=685454 RepID=A0A919PYG3_9ACTN|nr:hypothetical protein [Dactylosporangium siamense]GIG52696.1 hypothetical protein Dsi01nite_107370 [Dactylosporangium siamense]